MFARGETTTTSPGGSGELGAVVVVVAFVVDVAAAAVVDVVPFTPLVTAPVAGAELASAAGLPAPAAAVEEEEELPLLPLPLPLLLLLLVLVVVLVPASEPVPASCRMSSMTRRTRAGKDETLPERRREWACVWTFVGQLEGWAFRVWRRCSWILVTGEVRR